MNEDATIAHLRRRLDAAERDAAALRAVLASINDAVYVGGAAGITLSNQAGLDQLGFSTLTELKRDVGTLASEIMTRDAATDAILEAHEQPFARALSGERVVREVGIRHRLSGEERIVRCSASPVVLEGQVVGAVAVNTDITEQRRTTATLRDNERRQGFLLKLSDTLRPLIDAIAIQGEACRVLTKHLHVDRAYYVEIDEVQGIATVERDYVESGPSLAGRHPIASFAWSVEILRTGRGHVVADVQDSPVVPVADRAALEALQIRACVGAPLIKAGRLVGALCVTTSRVREWTPAEIELVREVGERIWAAVERARAEEAMRESERRLQTLVEGVPQLVWRAVEGGRWTWASPQWTAYTGQSEHDSHDFGWLDPMQPEDREAVKAIWSRAVDRGEFAADYRLRRAVDGEYRWFQTRATPVRDDAGAIVEWLGTSTDIDDLRQLQARQQVLVAELQHRTRNLMGVVRSTAESILRSSRDLEDFGTRYRDRIEALARVQGLLSRIEGLERIPFDELLRSELKALGAVDLMPGKLTLDGPPGIGLRSSTVQTFALALHELATNAVKYGALSQPSGRLSIAWHLEPAQPDRQPWLHVDWHESGVDMPPSGQATEGTGEGFQLITQALPYQLGAKTTYVMGPDGVRCSIALPTSTQAPVPRSIDEHASSS